MMNCRSSKATVRPASKSTEMKGSSQVHLFLLWCCLSALPLSSGSPHHFQDYFEEWDNNNAENLALCFSHWRALQTQPQLTKFVMDFCNTILQNMPRTEGDDSMGMYKRFLFHYSKTQTPHLKNALSAVHPLLHLAPKLSERRMDRSLDSPRNGRTFDVYSQQTKHHLKRIFFGITPEA
ncbi:neuromedin-S-like isoform X3 [Rhincodon typus]|uniref:neuromedin-S-like isoform X3 n=1 Tax=Rhincodon typus TaxID=259920 RepID=UPI00202FA370|nr:neuromedin-S-like isoform X3 [Rhincodon typus]